MTFTDAEIAYLDSQLLGRLTTIDAQGRPQIRAVGVHYNPETRTIDVVGWGLAKSQKFRNASRNPEVAFIVDDLASTNPWRPRSVEIRGRAETLTGPGVSPWGDEVIRIHPRRVVAEGLDPSGDGRYNARDLPS
ncbi:PPOX class F420-dependent oxidoreductase [Spiractinospora alimapuensis]|uniref:PPOX class F420-dependent oxidoreductase n=1 Tax=Spiractinospora alimapuensis TaxID=2820884 RepID=UPI001F1F3036|nr:PPOX class F420-dependent oxidoreductase [Spiractinospora alimapuensis]QVQ52988.1 PPOX class F420-dependent oxidoreductase [Spiractinospora alimapuensis]